MNGSLLYTTMSESSSENRWIVGGLVGIVIVSVLVVTVFGGSAAAHTGDDGFHHHDGWMGTHGGVGGWMAGGFLWMIVWTLVLLAVPVALVYLLVAQRGPTGGRVDDDALGLLRRRYAQGEIDEEEFETRRARLLADRE